MRLILATVILCFSFMAFSAEVTTQIHDVDMGLPGEEPLIFLTTGQVVKFPAGKENSVNFFHEAKNNQLWLKIITNEDREIIQFEVVSAPLMTMAKSSSNKLLEIQAPYTPSILKNLDHAREFFYAARGDAKKESQCYNRAHVWAYEWRTKKNLYASKTWLFFTRKFIRKYKFEWWFHVAPTVHVIVDGKVRQRVMDIKYALGPLKLKQWTNIFMRDNADCPVVEKYADHADFPESGSCFVMKSSMYYYQPVDLEQKDLTGRERNMWLEPEVKHAYLEAFDVTL